MRRSLAISFRQFQNWSSRLTLVLCPAITIERLETEETEDFTAFSPRNDHQDASLVTRSLWDIARFDHRMVVGLSPMLRRSSLILFEIVEDQFPVTLKNAQAPFQSRQPRSRHVRWFLG
jgi:hypothetical protein